MPDRVVSMYVMVFRRSEREITPDDWDWPTGGSYLDPVPENSYWTRMPLYNQYPLYVSTRIFTSDGLYPQEEQWTPPVIFTKHGDKGDTGANGGDGFDGSDGDPGAVGTPGTPGIDGAAGVSGDSIIWAGEAIANPLNPINGTAYYNTVEKKSFVFFDNAWYQMTVDGTDGQDGYHNAIVTLYRASTSSTVAPAAFSGTFSYDFTTGVLSLGDFNNWTQAMPSVPIGSYLWARQASAVSNTTTDYEILASEFTPAVVLSAVGKNGIDGLDGTSVVLKGSVATTANLPPGALAGDLYVVLADGDGYVSDGLGDDLSNWTNVGTIQGPQGEAGLSVQVVYHSASVTGGAPTKPTNAAGDDNDWYTDAIAASNWMSVKVDDGTGTTWGGAIQITGFDGLNSATVFLYIKNTSGTVAPTVMPTGPFTYTFATGGLTTAGNFNGWLKTPPTLTQGEFLWVMQATASSQTATDSIPFSEFSPPVVTTSAGKDGLTISYLGDLATPPTVAIKNQVYKDTSNGNVYICTVGGSPGTWVLMVADGSDGATGANGSNGLSVYITYNPASISGAAPTLPTDIAGTDNDWTTVASSNSNWMSQKIDANPAVSTNWGPAIRIKGDTGADLVANPNAPPAPVNLQVTSYYATIGLSWDQTTDPLAALAHILRHTSNDRGSAKIVGVTAGNTFIDTPPTLSTATPYFYWIRFISPSQVVGPDNLVNGTSGSTTADPAYLLSMLTGQLGYGQFDVTNGVFPIRTVTALPALPSNNWPYGSRAYLTTNKTIYFCDGDLFTAEVDQAAVRAQFGVGVLTAGSVLAESVGTNEIITNSANITDAVVTNAKIANLAVDSAKIANAAITDAHISSLSADKIVTGDMQAINMSSIMTRVTTDVLIYTTSGIYVLSKTTWIAIEGFRTVRYYGVNLSASIGTGTVSVKINGQLVDLIYYSGTTYKIPNWFYYSLSTFDSSTNLIYLRMTSPPYTINVESTDGYPSTGKLGLVSAGNNRGVFTYTGKTPISFTGIVEDYGDIYIDNQLLLLSPLGSLSVGTSVTTGISIFDENYCIFNICVMGSDDAFANLGYITANKMALKLASNTDALDVQSNNIGITVSGAVADIDAYGSGIIRQRVFYSGAGAKLPKVSLSNPGDTAMLHNGTSTMPVFFSDTNWKYTNSDAIVSSTYVTPE